MIILAQADIAELQRLIGEVPHKHAVALIEFFSARQRQAPPSPSKIPDAEKSRANGVSSGDTPPQPMGQEAT